MTKGVQYSLSPMELEDVIKNVTYKPGYRLSIQKGEPRRLVLYARVTCSRTGESRDISMNWPVPQGKIPEKDWLKFIRWCCICLEVHEAEEMLHYKGEIPYDPHV